MKSNRHAFTLIELLVVITVIGVLAGIALPVYQSIQINGKKVQSLANMRQMGIALIGYCGDNNGVLPLQGVQAPTWNSTAAEATAWYNVLPRNYGNGQGVGDYAVNPAGFYARGSMFYVPAALYPANGRLTAPLFAISYNSKLSGTLKDGTGASVTVDAASVRQTNFQSPARTCIFQESGLSGEKQIRSGQSSYNGQAYSFASRTVARYANSTIIIFADGHADLVTGTDAVAPGGKAYKPQSDGKVYWSMDPTFDVN